MIQTSQITETLPHSLEEFVDWEPNDGFKHEWNDGEIIKFTGMKKDQYYICHRLLKLFFDNGSISTGTSIAEPGVQLSGIQMRRPDIAFFFTEQFEGADGDDAAIPAFAIEIISSNDQINQMEEKLTEYFKAGVQVAWVIIPNQKVVYVHTNLTRREVKICLGSDICSAAPVLPGFEISVDDLLKSKDA